MTDSVPDAPGSASSTPGMPPIIARLEAWAEDHPGADYWVDSEAEAADILVALMAILRMLMRDLEDEEDRETLRALCRRYQVAVMRRRALDLLRDQTEDDQISIMGVPIRSRRVVVQ